MEVDHAVEGKQVLPSQPGKDSGEPKGSKKHRRKGSLRVRRIGAVVVLHEERASSRESACM